MKSYRAYGLCLHSAIELPELDGAEANLAADVQIRIGSLEGPLPRDQPRLVRFETGRAYFAWPSIGRVRVEGGSSITVDPLTTDDQAVRFALLGPAMAAILHQRKIALLHGSAVEDHGRAIVFIGAKRAGKSTTAAALVAAGCEMLNDDLVPLMTDSAGVSIAPGFPALKLEPAIHRRFLPHLPIVGRPSEGPFDKVVVAGSSTSRNLLPLAAVAILDPDASKDAALLSPGAALKSVLEHGYALQFGDQALANGQGRLLFQACARLARDLLVVRIGRPQNRDEFTGLLRRLRAGKPANRAEVTIPLQGSGSAGI